MGWLLQMKGKFPNKMSRILLACDDGTERTEIASDFLNDEGYTAVQAIDGGVDQYLEEFPLEEKDKIVWKMSDADRSGPDTSAPPRGQHRAGQHDRGPLHVKSEPPPPHRNNFLSPGFFI